ncbi:hypothetical protein F4561_001593 [Lipingzhangella halophila]|uniref:Uncharacterized protein n=1 Tax=Lipingzhangella halophila TaxID=1783352 RepID=A0A7W7RFM6_9ACTN|nr:hypothetical protein [Lipingzhangella halophila]MBB4930773.1 hypothetical protein [Lipingzhangella halophila]
MLTRSRLRHIFARLFRVLAFLVVVAYLGQAVLAGQFLSGTYPALRWHQLGATVSDVLLFVAVAVGALLRWQTNGRAWPFWASLGLLVANQIQNGAGAGRVISLHVPLGAAMLAAAVLIAVHSSTTGRLTGTTETEETA